MVPGEQHLRHFSAAPVFRTGVLRMLEQAVPVAFRRERFLVRQNARHHAAYCVRNCHRGDLSAGQHKVTDGNLLVHALVDKPLVNALIMAADQNKVLLCEQLTRFLLVKRLSLCREEHRVHMLAGTQRLMAQIQRLSQHDLSASAAIGRVIRLVVLVERIIADVGCLDLDNTLVLCASDDAFAHNRVDHLRKQRHNVDFHSIRPSMLST